MVATFTRWSYGGSPPWLNPNFMGKTLALGDLQAVKYQQDNGKLYFLIFLAGNYFAKAFLECQTNALQQQIEKGITKI
jgi:hypothetical protein